jgi:hypothetical protein
MIGPMSALPIRVVSTPLDAAAVKAFLDHPFPDMVKFVVDVQQEIVALGGELHADAEAVLLDRGSQQEFLWGGNYFPGAGERNCIEFTSLINIRPSDGNRTLTVGSPEIQARMRAIVFRLVGRGDALP